MLTALIGLFILVMAGGVGLALLEHRGRALPLGIGAVHGGLGVFAIALLVMQAVTHPGNHPLNAAIVVFILTALGGPLLFAFRISKQTLPLPVVVLHASFAVAALILLCIGWVRS